MAFAFATWRLSAATAAVASNGLPFWKVRFGRNAIVQWVSSVRVTDAASHGWMTPCSSTWRRFSAIPQSKSQFGPDSLGSRLAIL